MNIGVIGMNLQRTADSVLIVCLSQGNNRTLVMTRKGRS